MEFKINYEKIDEQINDIKTSAEGISTENLNMEPDNSDIGYVSQIAEFIDKYNLFKELVDLYLTPLADDIEIIRSAVEKTKELDEQIAQKLIGAEHGGAAAEEARRNYEKVKGDKIAEMF